MTSVRGLPVRESDLGFPSAFGFRPSSFVPERLHRIDPRRPAGGDVTGDTGNGSERQQDADERPNVAGFNLIEQTLQIVGEYQRSDYSQDHPAEHDPCTALEDQARDVSSCSSERHSHADLLRPPDDGISQYRIDSQR